MNKNMESDITELTAEEYRVWAKDHKHLLIDVREASEFEEGKLEYTHHIPLGSLEQKIDTLTKDQPVVVYCRAGGRSMHACQLLKTQGFEAINLKGGIKAWFS